MSKNHGPLRVWTGMKSVQTDNPNWRKKVNKKRKKNEAAKQARKKNR